MQTKCRCGEDLVYDLYDKARTCPHCDQTCSQLVKVEMPGGLVKCKKCMAQLDKAKG